MRYIVVVAALACLLCGAAKAESQKISVAVSYGVFYPTSGETKDQFDSSFQRISITTFDPVKPKAWRFIAEGGDYTLNGESDVELLPLTFGVERGFGGSSSLQPYMTFRGGPYFGKVENPTIGLNDHHIGLNMNATCGLVFKKRFYGELRYDFFSSIASTDFSGFSISGGVKLFDVKF